jgi:hypothetical protein
MMMGWPRRSSSVPGSVAALDFDVVVGALIDARVCVLDAARALGVPTSDLRRAMAATPALLDIAINADEERVDRAMRNLDEMLQGDDKLLKKEASFFVLRQHRRAAQRGWRQPDAEVNVNANVNLVPVRYVWGNGEEIGRDMVPEHLLPRTIEHDPDERARVDEERRRQGDHDSR